MGAVSAEDLDNSLSDGMDNALDTGPVLIESDEISADSGLLAGDANDDSGYENGQDLDSGLGNAQSPVLGDEDDVITVNDWDELQHYCSLEDRNYTLKLKENTNFYPLDGENSSYQIVIRNNVTILGSEGAYIGDSSPDARFISYAPMLTEDDSGIGVHLENLTFKWIATRYGNEGVFLTMAGNTTNLIKNCYFYNITTTTGHSSIVYIRRGDAALENCTFINCSNSFGCVSIYDPRDDPSGVCNSARMTMDDCYFENNNGVVEPGCINNCGVLILNNTTFLNNSAGWWAGAIHTHGGANTTIYNCNFTDNLAGWNGGALYTYSWLQVYNTIFKGNKCITNNGGGAIGACWYQHSPFIHIEDSYFEDNENTCWELGGQSTTGTGRGGAISIMDDGLLEIYNSTFIKNSASIGTAICALQIDYSGNHSPLDVIIIGNKFINNTRSGDVLDVHVNSTSTCIIEDNYYLNNSILFSKLNLTYSYAEEVFSFNIDVDLKNPSSYDADIMDKCMYDIYLNGTYYKTIKDRNFTLSGMDGTYVHVCPSISSIPSNGFYLKNNSTVSIEVSDIEYGENQTIVFRVSPDDATGNLTVLFNNHRIYKINLTNPTLNLDVLPAGTYNLSVTYNGDLKYFSSMSNTSFKVNRKILSDDVFENNSNVTIKLPTEAKGTLTLVIEGITLKKDIVNGTVTIGIDAFGPGKYEATVMYSGDENFAPISKNITLFVKQEVPSIVSTKITASKVTATYGIAKNLVVTLRDKNGKALVSKKITVKVGSISKTLTTNSKGQVILNVATLVPKTYTATVKFAGDNYYDASSLTSKVVVNRAKVKLTAKAKTFKVKVKVKKLKVTLKNNKGKAMKKIKLKLKVGKNTYTAKTNNNGVATFNIKLIKKGKYTATVKFAGNNYFKALSKKVKLTIKK